MVMNNLHAVSSAGSGSSHDLLPGLTLHLDFMMCFKKKKQLTASGGATTDICSTKSLI